jgi:transcriptional antiterminator RfaH
VPWYVARTKAWQERKAAASLTQRGIRVYLPELRKRRRCSGEQRGEPLFPNYLFANLDLGTDQWLAARSAPFVAYFLAQGDEPIPVPDGLVEDLRLRAEQSAHEGRLPFQPGDRVRITQGPFKDFEGIFQAHVSGQRRVQILLDFINRQVRLTIGDTHVKSAN